MTYVLQERTIRQPDLLVRKEERVRLVLQLQKARTSDCRFPKMNNKASTSKKPLKKKATRAT